MARPCFSRDHPSSSVKIQFTRIKTVYPYASGQLRGRRPLGRRPRGRGPLRYTAARRKSAWRTAGRRHGAAPGPTLSLRALAEERSPESPKQSSEPQVEQVKLDAVLEDWHGADLAGAVLDVAMHEALACVLELQKNLVCACPTPRARREPGAADRVFPTWLCTAWAASELRQRLGRWCSSCSSCERGSSSRARRPTRRTSRWRSCGRQRRARLSRSPWPFPMVASRKSAAESVRNSSIKWPSCTAKRQSEQPVQVAQLQRTLPGLQQELPPPAWLQQQRLRNERQLRTQQKGRWEHVQAGEPPFALARVVAVPCANARQQARWQARQPS